eukprot:GHVH01002501.1.p1 GENE.GHVH01002501.1~~GHVH01002501.1.p1  ORF type:complete len:329 (-),score=23.50 GHVH01002501.1:202-1188(-)
MKSCAIRDPPIKRNNIKSLTNGLTMFALDDTSWQSKYSKQFEKNPNVSCTNNGITINYYGLTFNYETCKNPSELKELIYVLCTGGRGSEVLDINNLTLCRERPSHSWNKLFKTLAYYNTKKVITSDKAKRSITLNEEQFETVLNLLSHFDNILTRLLVHYNKIAVGGDITEKIKGMFDERLKKLAAEGIALDTEIAENTFQVTQMNKMFYYCSCKQEMMEFDPKRKYFFRGFKRYSPSSTPQLDFQVGEKKELKIEAARFIEQSIVEIYVFLHLFNLRLQAELDNSSAETENETKIAAVDLIFTFVKTVAETLNNLRQGDDIDYLFNM